MKKESKKGNKYQQFSSSVKGTEEALASGVKKGYGVCPTCKCCQASHIGEKSNLCYNCYFGYKDHQKLGKPKDHLQSVINSI